MPVKKEPVYRLTLKVGQEERRAEGDNLHELFQEIFNPQVKINTVLKIEKGKQKFETLITLVRARRMAINPLSREILIKLISNGMK